MEELFWVYYLHNKVLLLLSLLIIIIITMLCGKYDFSSLYNSWWLYFLDSKSYRHYKHLAWEWQDKIRNDETWIQTEKEPINAQITTEKEGRLDLHWEGREITLQERLSHGTIKESINWECQRTCGRDAMKILKAPRIWSNLENKVKDRNKWKSFVCGLWFGREAMDTDWLFF